ncbi:MAG TPA: peptidoglycan-binding protein [Actinobacteria bacterium]|nr:peptidoglycan-binding protein [Actinomycetota bacterium]
MCSIPCLTIEHVFGILGSMTRTRVRWGRVAALAMAVVVSVGGVGGIAGAGQTHAPRPVSYTVRAGDTVWALAKRAAGPTADPRAMVDRIVALNHLSTGDIQAGQHLLLPPR